MDYNTSWRIVKLIMFAALLAAVGIIGFSFIPTNSPNEVASPVATATPHNVTAANQVDVSAHFIGECAQMDMTDPKVRMYAVSECVGRVRGFVDAHNVMVAIVARAGGVQAAKAVRLFCVNPDVTTDQLVSAIMDWANAHVDDYAHIMTADPQDGATVVMIRALHATYPCANT